jgi:hypothetical protein
VVADVRKLLKNVNFTFLMFLLKKTVKPLEKKRAALPEFISYLSINRFS